MPDHLKTGNPTWMTALVWALRVIVGGVFIFSGFVKGVDPWGSIIKIEEYLAVWRVDVPRTMTVIASMGLAWGEFVAGALLLLGCYRRIAVWLITAFMAVMTALTLYLWIDDPVSDCGCFGDFLILTNGATFAKNIAIDLMLVPLLLYNSRVRGVFTPWSQWAVGAVLTLYIAVIGLMGYNIQPIFDFRRFPVGTQLANDPGDDGSAENEPVEYTFTYEKNGDRRDFTEDELPDSTWIFIDRHITSGSENTSDSFAIIDSEGNDVTTDAVYSEGDEVLVVIPDITRVNPSHTFAINEIDRRLHTRGASLVTLLGPGDDSLNRWLDISMTESPVFTAEPTLLKELVRGKISLVYLRDGKILWKRTLSSIDTGLSGNELEQYSDYPGKTPLIMTIMLLIALSLLFMLDLAGLTIWSLTHRRRHKKTADSGITDASGK